MRRRWQLNQDGIWVRTALEQETRIEQAERVKKQKTDRKDAQFLLRLMREKQLSANLDTESGELGSATTAVEPASVGAVAHADHESAAGASHEGLSLVELLFVVIQSCFHQQNSNLVLHLLLLPQRNTENSDSECMLLQWGRQRITISFKRESTPDYPGRV